MLHQRANVGLAEACFRAKELDRTQKIIEELTGRKDGTLGDLSQLRFAGQVQRATGTRVVEGRIKLASTITASGPSTWSAGQSSAGWE